MISSLQRLRLDYKPKLPAAFSPHGAHVRAIPKEGSKDSNHDRRIKENFPNLFGARVLEFAGSIESAPQKINVGVIFSGGQAPGGHNVIAGLFDGLKSLTSDNKLFGFRGGPSGLLSKDYIELTAERIAPYRNTGGFDMIGSGRTKLESVDQFDIVRRHCNSQNITGLVIIGGDDSNTNACLLAEYFLKTNAGINVIGCPKTIDGDLKNAWVETSFGFDTACKVYGELVGNICRDAMSAKKYWHFIKVMGRSASHIALECALQTHPDITIISEEAAVKNWTLEQIVDCICSIVLRRSNNGSNYGVVLIPEGLIEFIPEIKKLILELNELLAHAPNLHTSLMATHQASELMSSGLSAESARAFLSLPPQIRSQLVMDRDPHGNVQVAQIETEKLLVRKVKDQLASLQRDGKYKGEFSALSHYLGYEGRCAMPTNFDANYCYSLGFTAAALVGGNCSGYLASIKNSTSPVSEWVPIGVPFTKMMNIERRHGQDKPVIKKALVDLDGNPFKAFESERDEWVLGDNYLSPGPIQFFGPKELCDEPTITLKLERNNYRFK